MQQMILYCFQNTYVMHIAYLLYRGSVQKVYYFLVPIHKVFVVKSTLLLISLSTRQYQVQMSVYIFLLHICFQFLECYIQIYIPQNGAGSIFSISKRFGISEKYCFNGSDFRLTCVLDNYTILRICSIVQYIHIVYSIYIKYRGNNLVTILEVGRFFKAYFVRICTYYTFFLLNQMVGHSIQKFAHINIYQYMSKYINRMTNHLLIYKLLNLFINLYEVNQLKQ
eukprot:TRINITY_DN9052_c1_g1_i2.p1 TRINITY_DN9052_c1_g1~~TRINITY_DN9052_c1_g1_i2.p1  ORF type:complete len:224 (-),score=-28.82 TRINITY_DN9052_c1_g1_i2:74-745(-)